jgi:SAM-dependent methyltransferase
MTDYEGFFGEEVAARYDEPGGENDPTEVTPAVDLLEQLAAGGPVLEFAIGTGRVAVPLHERGLEVHGIDDSPAMVAKLREKVGDAIPVEIGDMATAHVDGEFALVYLVFTRQGAHPTESGSLPLRVACGAGLDGSDRPHEPDEPLGRLAALNLCRDE